MYTAFVPRVRLALLQLFRGRRFYRQYVGAFQIVARERHERLGYRSIPTTFGHANTAHGLISQIVDVFKDRHVATLSRRRTLR